MLTKLYVKESYESHAASVVGSSTHSSLEPAYRPPLQRGSSLLIEDAADMFLSYRASQDMDDEDEEESGGPRDALEGFSDFSRSPPGGDPLKHFAGALDFKPFDSLEQGSHSSSASNAVDAASPRATDDEGREYHPVSPFGTSPFDMELGGAAETGAHTPAGSLANTPSPLEHFKPFSPLRPRKSSSLSNVLDDGSCGTDPPTGDTISNTSNPQVLPPSLPPSPLPRPSSPLTQSHLTHPSPSVLQQTPEEELCNLLTNIIFSVLWSRSGLEGAEDVVWRERGQVFSVLTKLGSSCQLVRPPDDIKRRSVTHDVRIPAVRWFSVTDG